MAQLRFHPVLVSLRYKFGKRRIIVKQWEYIIIRFYIFIVIIPKYIQSLIDKQEVSAFVVLPI